MILEQETYDAYGYYPSALKPQSRKRILAYCDICGEFRAIRKDGYHSLCVSCSQKGKTLSEDHKRKISEAKKGVFEGDKNPNWKGGLAERVCKFCGKTFYVKKSAVKRGYGIYCSRSCSGKSKTSNKSRSWKGGEVKRICKVCGKTFYAEQYRVKRGDGIYCSPSCHAKDQRHDAKPKMTAPERIFEAICKKYALPFTFVGDGSLWLGNANPDFMHTSKKIVVEVFGNYWHDPLINRNISEIQTVEGRTKQLAAEGYKTIILWEIDLKRIDAEKFILHEMHNRGIIK